MKKELSCGSSEIAKNKENAFLCQGGRVQYITYWSLTCLIKSSFVFDLIAWSTIESQRYTNFSYYLLWEYKNSNVEKKRMN